MAVALRVLVQRQLGFRLGARRHLRLAWPDLRWLQQQADSTPLAPVTRPAMRSQQQANSPALEKPQAREKQMDSQVKLWAPLCPVMLGWLQQVEPMGPVLVTRPAMRLPQQEMSMQQADSLALEEEARPQALEKKPKAQVKLPAPLWPVNLPGQQSLRGSHSAQAKCRG